MFVPDNRTEQYLNSSGVQYDYRESIQYMELVPDWNAKNHGRPKGDQKISKAIDTYAEQMLGGSAAPGVVLHQTPAGLDVLDGIQRLNSGLLCDYTKFGGYVVRCCDETAMKIRICINNRLSGVAQNPADFAIDQMVDLFMIRGNESAADVASFVGRSKADVEKAFARASTRNLVSSLYVGEEDAPALKLEVYDTIATEADPSDFDGKSGEVVRKFINIIDRCKFPNGDAKRYTKQFFGIRRLKNKDRATQFRSKLTEIKRDPIVKTKLAGKKRSTSIENMHRHFRTLHNAVKAHKSEQIDNEDYIRSFDEMWLDIGRRLREQCSPELRRRLDPFSG